VAGKQGKHLKLLENRAFNAHPRWKSLPTKAIRVPEEYADILLKIARRLDNQTLSIQHVEEAIAAKTEEIKQEVIAGVQKLNAEN
jgi:hypothetical protein